MILNGFWFQKPKKFAILKKFFEGFEFIFRIKNSDYYLDILFQSIKIKKLCYPILN